MGGRYKCFGIGISEIRLAGDRKEKIKDVILHQTALSLLNCFVFFLLEGLGNWIDHSFKLSSLYGLYNRLESKLAHDMFGCSLQF
jgi:hypothetical protein